MAAAADALARTGPTELRRLPLFGAQIRVAGYGGLRLGEQHALRAIDVFFDRGVVAVNGSWTQPRALDSVPFRGPVKNGRVHEAPLPRSVLAQLLPRCAALLGLADNAAETEVVRAQTAERIARGKRASSPDRWWEAEVDPAQELWLFIDTDTGLPPRSELLNDRWHRVRRWLEHQEPASTWPSHSLPESAPPRGVVLARRVAQRVGRRRRLAGRCISGYTASCPQLRSRWDDSPPGPAWRER